MYTLWLISSRKVIWSQVGSIPTISTMNKEYKKKVSSKKSRYGISEQLYMGLMAIPSCEICGVPFIHNQEKCIDHDHKTERIRGILCNSCNKGLGFFKDDVELLEKAKKYIQRGD